MSAVRASTWSNSGRQQAIASGLRTEDKTTGIQAGKDESLTCSKSAETRSGTGFPPSRRTSRPGFLIETP